MDSLVWRNKENINNWDHGRQLQSAITVQNYGECWNPTEAGGSSDGIGTDTKSILTYIHATGVYFRPHYCLQQPSGTFCPKGQPSYNEEDALPFEMKRKLLLVASPWTTVYSLTSLLP